MRQFLFIWVGQVVAGSGANLAAFCLGIWLYRQSGSVMQFALLQFFHTIPALLLAGAAGRAADRRNRRTTMMTSDALTALVAIAYLVLFQAGAARPWLVYALGFAGGCIGSFQWPAYRSWSTHLVHARHFGRVGGIMKLGEGIPFLLGPVLGGALMVNASLPVVFAIQLAASLTSLMVLAAAAGRGAAPGSPAAEKGAGRGGPRLADFLRSQPGLVGLLVLAPLVIFTEGWVVTLFQPFMLHHLDPSELGLMLSLGGTGVVVGGVVMGLWGGPRRQIFSVLGAILVQSLLVGTFALAGPSLALWTGAAFLYFASLPFLSGSNQAIWQTLTPLDLQGRMFALRRATEAAAGPAAMLSAGVLVDYVLDPLLRPGGALAPVAALLPAGPGRPIAVLFLTVCALNLALLAVALLWRPVRRVDIAAPAGDRAAAPAGASSTPRPSPAGRPA